jgi:hypothetical protein
MRRIFAAAAVWVGLAGCTPPAPPVIREQCPRSSSVSVEFVDFPNFDFLGLEGQPVELVFNSPLTTCEGDVLSARIEGVGSDGVPFELEPGPVSEHAGAPAQVRPRFTPPGPGLFTFRVAFEPSLGVRTTYLVVAAVPRSTPAGIDLAIDCDDPWPLTADTIACESVTNGVELFSVDGGYQSFDGAALAVAGDVLWSVSNAGVLERRTFEDGGLALTHQHAGFSHQPMPSEQGAEFALRLTTEFRANLINADAGSRVTVDNYGFMVLVHPLGLSHTPCAPSGLCIGPVVGADPRAVWIRDRFQVIAMPRPIARGQFGALNFPSAQVTSTEPTNHFERIPFWLRTSQGTEVLLSMDLGEPSAIALPRDQVLKVGREFLALALPDGGVRIVRR